MARCRSRSRRWVALACRCRCPPTTAERRSGCCQVRRCSLGAMNLRQIGIAAAVGVGAVLIGAGVAVAQPDDGDGSPITGDALAKATEAALAVTGGGTVTQTEVGDEESYYQVEVTLADG